MEMALHLALSENPTNWSLDMIFMKGKPLSIATVAARAVLPAPMGPSSIAESTGVLSDALTWRGRGLGLRDRGGLARADVLPLGGVALER